MFYDRGVVLVLEGFFVVGAVHPIEVIVAAEDDCIAVRGDIGPIGFVFWLFEAGEFVKGAIVEIVFEIKDLFFAGGGIFFVIVLGTLDLELDPVLVADKMQAIETEMFGFEGIFYDEGDGGCEAVVIEEWFFLAFCGIDDIPFLSFAGFVQVPESCALF